MALFGNRSLGSGSNKKQGLVRGATPDSVNQSGAAMGGVATKPTRTASPPGQEVAATHRALSKTKKKPLSESVTLLNGYVPPPKFLQVRAEVQQFLVNEAPPVSEIGGAAEVRQLIEPVFKAALENASMIVSRTERMRMLDLILSDILGFGPIQPLLDRDDITEVMVNGSKNVYMEFEGQLTRTDIQFIDDSHVLQVIERIVSPLGRRIDESSPMVDARLPDGSRVNAIIPPLAVDGPSLTIRKFRADPFKAEDLIKFGSFTPEFHEFIDACVVAKLNIVISGGTGTGKTTMLNVLSSSIPMNERIVTIEDAAELQLQQPHIVRLEKRPPNIEGKGEVSIRELVKNSLRMRPDRIVIGEVRGGETLDMLQAMNTGHDGSLTTVHANTARDTLNRIETLVMMSGLDLPLRAIRQQMASAVDMIVQIGRLRDGSRRVIQCAEVMGMEGDMIVMQDIFTFEQKSVDEDGKIIGALSPTGLRPRATTRIADAGITLAPSIYGAQTANIWDN